MLSDLAHKKEYITFYAGTSSKYWGGQRIHVRMLQDIQEDPSEIRKVGYAWKSSKDEGGPGIHMRKFEDMQKDPRT